MPIDEDEDQDHGEVAILRGPAAKRFLDGLGGAGDDEDEDETFDDDEGNTWQKVKKASKPAKKAPVKKAAKKRTYFGS